MNLQKKFNSLTDINNHNEATKALNDAYLGCFPESTLHTAYGVIIENIMNIHALLEYMPAKEMAMRDAIQSALLHDCKIIGLM